MVYEPAEESYREKETAVGERHPGAHCASD